MADKAEPSILGKNTAEFTIEGKTFRVIKCEYGFSQNVDLFGKPVPWVTSDPIKLEIVGTNDETSISWATNNKKKLNGSISIYRSDQSVLKEIKFEDGYCVKYKEDIQLLIKSSLDTPYRHCLEISAKVISIGDIKHDNHWPE
jgi:hypothetical protein